MSGICRLAPVLLLCFLAAAATAFGVSIGVDGVVEGRVTPVDRAGPTAWTVELENPGSVTYDARLRLDVLQGNRTVFRTAATPARLPPGSIASRTLAVTDASVQGNVTLRFVMGYGSHEAIAERRTVLPPRNTNTGVGIALPRVGEKQVSFLLVTPNAVESAYVTVHGYPTWRFQQQRVATDGVTRVTVPFRPAAYPGDRLTVTVGSVEGRYHHTEDVVVRPADGIDGVLVGIQGWAAVHLPFGHVFIT